MMVVDGKQRLKFTVNRALLFKFISHLDVNPATWFFRNKINFLISQFAYVNLVTFTFQLKRSEERRVGKECVVRVDLGGRRIIKTKKLSKQQQEKKQNKQDKQ